MEKNSDTLKSTRTVVLITNDCIMKKAWEALFTIYGQSVDRFLTCSEISPASLLSLSYNPDLIILSFPRRYDNHLLMLRALRECKEYYPSAQFALLADKMSDYAFSRAFYNDKFHLISTQQSLDALWMQISSIAKRKQEQFVSPSFYSHFIRIHKPCHLSKREAEIIYLSGMGYSVHFIAQYQNRSVQTISTLKRRAMMKLNMHHILDIYHLIESKDFNDMYKTGKILHNSRKMREKLLSLKEKHNILKRVKVI